MLKADFSVLSSLRLNQDVFFKANTGAYSIAFTIPKFIARIMSSKFEAIYESDELVDHFEFSLDSDVVSKCWTNGNEEYEEIFVRKAFDKIVKAFLGQSVNVSFAECELINEIAKTIGSNVIFIPPETDLNNNNCCDILRLFGSQESFDYVAENFEFLKEDEIIKIEPKELTKVLKSEKLKVNAESTLLERLIQYIKVRGYENISLISNVDISFLGTEGRIKYFKFIRKALTSLNVEEGIREIWNSVGNFITDSAPKAKRFHESDDLQMVPNMNVEITASSHHWVNNIEHDIEGFKKQPDNYRCFATNDESNSWIMWGFPQEVKISSYEIWCRIGCDIHHPRNWKIEVSMDNKKWELLDEQHNQNMLTMNQKNRYNIIPKAAKYIKMTQIGLDSTNKQHLCFRRMRFAGWYSNI